MQWSWDSTEDKITVNEQPPKIEGYEILSKLGTGGMSTVWKAYDRERAQVVALKLLNPELAANPDDVDLFISEEQAMRNISHPGIVKSYCLKMCGDAFFYVMEYVDGYNFGSLLMRKQYLQEVDCLLICESLATALDYVWNEHGIVHCDIKPENIMINTDGIVKLTDLGLCHTFRYLKDGRQDVPDHVTGTPAYISPEQVYGDVELDCRSDIYSLAASLYHLATGRVLFPGLSFENMLRAHCSDEVQARDPRTYRPELSDSFCRLLEAMLIKDRENRIPSWKDILDMCLEIERGIIFKPRATPGISSLKLGE